MGIRRLFKSVLTVCLIGFSLLLISQVFLSDLLFDWEYNIVITILYIPLYFLWLRYGCKYVYNHYLNKKD